MYSSQHRGSPERVLKPEIKRQVAGYVSTAPISSPTGGHHYDYASPPGSAAQKLGHVAERFSSFYNDLESEKQHRRETDAQRRAALTEAVQKLERSLDAEIKRRAEADKGIQASLEAEIKAVHEKLAGQIREQNLQLKASIDALSRTFAELHGQLREEKEQRRVDLEHLTQTIGAKVEEAHSGLDDERVARLEREAATLKRVGEDVFRVQEKIDTERATREAAMEMLQREVRDSMAAHNESEESFQHMVLDDIATLKNQMLVEREERMSEDEQIVQAINDYTKALQDGLRIVNN